MASAIGVYLEEGAKRTFAGALDWPGWSRSGRNDAAALEALVAYGRRYAAAIGDAGGAFRAPGRPAELEVVERIRGSAGTDFGAPSHAPSADAQALDGAGLDRQVRLLEAAWSAFDAAAAAAVRSELRKGPRGGGRNLGKIVGHVLEADEAYLASLGGRYRSSERDLTRRTAAVRAAIVEMLGARVRGEPLPPSRRTTLPWTPRYMVRRSAWHALDHAWEIEDRAMPGGTA